MQGSVREPAVAGQFYSGTREALLRELRDCFTTGFGPGEVPEVDEQGPRRIVGLVSPHAGYMYSGGAAARGYFALARDGRPDLFVIIGPSHRVDTGVALDPSDGWRTPLGVAKVDGDFLRTLAKLTDVVRFEEHAHLYEHSLEVQVPFLQFIYGEQVSIAPICMGDQSLETARALGEALARAVTESGRDAVIIASTDFTHYEPKRMAELKDRRAIEAILALDPEGLYRVRREAGLTMCGPGPTATMLYCARALGASEAELLSYYTSGDVIGDFLEVVGYASIAVYR